MGESVHLQPDTDDVDHEAGIDRRCGIVANSARTLADFMLGRGRAGRANHRPVRKSTTITTQWQRREDGWQCAAHGSTRPRSDRIPGQVSSVSYGELGDVLVRSWAGVAIGFVPQLFVDPDAAMGPGRGRNG